MVLLPTAGIFEVRLPHVRPESLVEAPDRVNGDIRYYGKHMNLDSWVKLVLSIAVPLLAVVGVGSRRKVLRTEIRENLELVKLLSEDEILSAHTPARGWLQGKIAVDVARLAGQRLGNPKKPIPWGSVIFAGLLAVGFGAWTYWLDHDGFVWYSVFPALGALLFLMSIAGQFMNRELPTSEQTGLPAGATPLRSGNAQEEVAGQVQLAASGAHTEMFADSGQIGVALRFIDEMRRGEYELALESADRNWLRCRIQSWIWNNTSSFGEDPMELGALTDSLFELREPAKVWSSFVELESANFSKAWAAFTPDDTGAASRRRRISRDCDLVIVVPLGKSGGYFVMSATSLPNALTILMRHDGEEWLVANHVAPALPLPGFPPVWWNVNDPAIEALPEA